MFWYLLITSIIMLIRKNVLWKKYLGLTGSLFVLSIILLSFAPPTEDKSTKTEVKSEKVVSKKDSQKDTQAVATTSDQEQQQKLDDEKKQQEELAKKLNLEAATVSRVVDGDTFELTDGRKVRLIGVNTPESTTRTEEYGKEASNYTHSKLEGKQIWLQKDVSETDQYGRLLRIVWLQVPTDVQNEKEIRSKMFNADLVLNGYAEPSTYPPDVEYSDYFVKFAREAREQDKGLWALGEYGTTKGDLDPKPSTNTTASSTPKSSSSNSSNSEANSSSSTRSNSNSNSNSSSNSSAPAASSGGTEYFANCTELRKVYPNGVPADHPAYQPKLDRDKDNYACER
ncbi:nuclease [Anoxybacillus sp. UARK-01]|nr:nuclease [Anoxybacillus sp. UARK-01]